MCGIIGSLHFNKKRDFSIKPAMDVLIHRGPDETHIIERDFWTVGVNRLAITSKGEKNTQPLWSPDKRYCFVFNGQIYNYKSIKNELLDLGCSFTTKCDSEVLFYSYLKWGTEAFLKCQGMFAMAIFDTLENKWILARDPLGIKPLYFYLDKNTFIFSSEIKPILFLKKTSINKAVLSSYLERRFTVGKETFFKNIYRLLPGESVFVHNSDKKTRFVKYWTATTKNKFKGKNSKERLDEFSKQLERSVDMTSQSEESIGVLLSGGLDSSVIHSLFSSCQKDSEFNKMNWFFDNTYDSQERDFAEKQTSKWNQNLYKVYPEEKDFVLLPDVIKNLEEPLADSIVLPTYKLMKNISQKQRILLSGEGADELLAGYAHHWMFYFFNLLSLGYKSQVSNFQSSSSQNSNFQASDSQDFNSQNSYSNESGNLSLKEKNLNTVSINPFVIIDILKFFPESLLNFFLPYPGSLKKQRLLESLSVLKKSGLKRYIETNHLWTQTEIKNLFKEEAISQASIYPNINSLMDLQCFDIQSWLANYNLLRVDKLSMAFSIEVRLPYLNLDFVECCLSLPQKDIVSLFRRKKILRKSAYKNSWLDFKFANRKKHPFTWKERAVYNSSLYKDFVFDHLDESFKKTWEIDSSALNKFLENSFSSNKNLLTDKQVTSLLHLAIWTKEFF